MSDPVRSPASLLSGDRCGRLRELFDAALEQPADARQAWIDASTGDPDDRAALRLLLAAEAGGGPLDGYSTDYFARIGAPDAVLADGLVGQRIGAFRLLRMLGQGGMAAVFLAEREGAGFSQKVAVKLLRRGLYSALEQRLFRREQQALAALSHPNIARLIDGGVTDAGIPYLVLDYVDGLPITYHAADRQLDLHARLRLFIAVCRAVEAAHRQLIVHRDLKPANILVDGDGQVKLLDFGIAKLLAEADEDGGATRTGMAPLTPGYAAPEQYAGGPVTMATDVHALGVVLYELLVGARPPAGRTHSTRPSQAVTDPAGDTVDPRRATPVPGPALRGDLDNIVLKALAAEPERRYATAADLANDIQCHLDQRPVRAHPPSRWYRTSKFVRRHRGSVAVTLALALGLLASLGVALWQTREARLEAGNARAEAQRAATTRDFIEQLFEPVRQELAEGRMPSLRDLVASGAQQVQAEPDLAPAQRVDLLLMFARLQHKLAQPESAAILAEQAYGLAGQALAPGDPVRVQALLERGASRLVGGRIDDAEGDLREVERRYADPGHPAAGRIRLYGLLARLENERGRPERSLDYAQRELVERIALHGADHRSVANSHNNLGYALEGLGRFDDAIAAYQRALDIHRRRGVEGSLQRAFPLGNLAQAEFNAGRLRDAQRHFDEVLALHADVDLERPPRILIGQLGMLAETQLVLGELDEASTTAARVATLAEHSPLAEGDRALAARMTARLELERGRFDDARTGFAAIDSLLPALPAAAQARSRSRRALNLGELALHAGDPQAAMAALADGLATLGVAYPPHLTAYHQALLALACVQLSQPCPGEPEAAARAALAQPPQRDHPALLPAHVALARIDLARAQAPAAVARLRPALDAAHERSVRGDSPRMGQAWTWLAVAQAHLRDCDAVREALAQADGAHSAWPAHPLLAEARSALASAPDCPTAESS